MWTWTKMTFRFGASELACGDERSGALLSSLNQSDRKNRPQECVWEG